jgi:hypothetical protein
MQIAGHVARRQLTQATGRLDSYPCRRSVGLVDHYRLQRVEIAGGDDSEIASAALVGIDADLAGQPQATTPRRGSCLSNSQISA